MPTRQTGNEEQDDGLHTRQQQRSQRPARQTNSHGKQAQRDSTSEDEYTNPPKIRRASRPTFEEEQPLPITTNKLPVVDDYGQYSDDEQDMYGGRDKHIKRNRYNTHAAYDDDEAIRPASSVQSPRSPRQDRAKMSHVPAQSISVPEKRRRPYDVHSPATPRQTASRTSSAQGPQRSARNTPSQPRSERAKSSRYEQYSRYGRHEKQARTHTALSVVQDFARNRILVAISIGTALLLILLPILINLATRNNATSNVVTSTGQTSNGSSSSQGLSHQATYPHELVIMPPETDHPAPPVFATSAYLLDADTGDTLYAYNPFVHLPMMSTTKLMTATLAMEQGNLDQNVTINAQIANDLNTLSSDSSLMGIKKGETYTLRQLMYGLMLVSGNDAAIAIADTIGGNLPHFVTMMNIKAQSLNLLDTHYMNPHGLLATGHYSSAHDLAILARYAFSIPGLRTIDGTRTYDISQSSSHAAHHMVNGNQFLWWYPGVDGGKPGWDGGSNFVQVVSCTRNGHHLIGVVMHTVNWWTDMRDLMNWGFDTFTWVSPAITDQHSSIPYDNLWNYFSDDKTTAYIPTASGRYYVYTGYSVSSPILAYFDHNGGLNKFGFPTSLLTANGNASVSQKFQHATIQCDLSSNQCRTA